MSTNKGWVDPARAIWGDAVVDEAERINQRIKDGDNSVYTESGWLHKTKQGPLGGVPNACCIVGHLNWIAAEKAGLDPIANGISSWPANGRCAFEDLHGINPDAPKTVTLPTASGKSRRYAASTIMGDMIRLHDDTQDRTLRRTLPYWGYKAYQWFARKRGFTPVEEPVEEPVESAADFVAGLVAPEKEVVHVVH